MKNVRTKIHGFAQVREKFLQSETTKHCEEIEPVYSIKFSESVDIKRLQSESPQRSEDG